jgi:SpoVK/Ycf46/Vps4 family AAA+-type ATPase
MALNTEFSGNPGTAKTTVARILAGIFHEIGLLESADIVEVGRSDLIAGYVGQTAPKVRDVFKKADGKLLFIDEAYSLVDASKNDFGDEAIDTIVQEMENRRDRTIVIFAGYPDRMAEFFDRNPGLRSRVPFSVKFSDYPVETLVKIAESEASKRGFAITADAVSKVNTICAEAASQPQFGNGRFCRNLVENAILNFASRNFGSESATAMPEALDLIPDDFAMPTLPEKPKPAKKFGFV